MASRIKPLTDEERRLLYEDRKIEEEATAEPIEIDPAKLPAHYSSARQGKGINGLIASATNGGGIQLNALTHAGTMESEGVIITIDEEAINNINAQTFKTLIILLTEVTKQLPRKNAITAEAINKGRTVDISLSKYMEICEIKDRKEGRSQLNKTITALYYVSLEWDEDTYKKPEGKSRTVKTRQHHRMRITDHTITQEEGNPVKNGVATFKFSFDMAEYLSGAFILPYNTKLLSINTHLHPYSIPLGWKLFTHNNMNYGKQNYGRIAVKTLLNAAKGIPRYETIASKGEIYRRIIAPFDRDLQALIVAEVLASYSYLDADGKPVERSQLSGYSHAQFILFTLLFELEDYPEAKQAERLENKQKRLEAHIRQNTKKSTAHDGGET